MVKYNMTTSEFLSGLDEYLDSFDAEAFLESMISPDIQDETISAIDMQYAGDKDQTNIARKIKLESFLPFSDVRQDRDLMEIAA